MKKHTLISLERKAREQRQALTMLTCYDYTFARLLNETALDMLLVGDSAANVMLGQGLTNSISVQTMELFGKAVRLGAPDKFLVVDVPFLGTGSLQRSINQLCQLFAHTSAEALKLEGSSPFHLKLIKELTDRGIPIMAHLGLMPQSVHAQGGFRTHGKSEREVKELKQNALKVQEAGAFALVLECVTPLVVETILEHTQLLTIGIGSGDQTHGQVLVLHDLLGLSPSYPSFAKPLLEGKALFQAAVAQFCDRTTAQ